VACKKGETKEPTPTLMINTGRFIMYSGITKILDRKTAGHVFTKRAKIERTTRNFFFPGSYFYHSSHFCR
jgi:hypothetical protein